MLAPQLSIPVPLVPTVEFTASTPPLEDSQLFASQSETSQFQDADEDYRPLTGSWGDIVEQEEQANSAAAAAVSAVLASLPIPVAAINAAAGDTTMSPVVTTATVESPPATPIPIASLLLSSSTTVSESTVKLPRVSTGKSGTMGASPAATAATAPDTRRLLQDMDIMYAIRLAPAPDAEVTTDALLTSFRSTMSCEELLHIVQLLFDLQWDTSVFLTEGIAVARPTDQLSDDILDEITRLLRRFIGGVQRQ